LYEVEFYEDENGYSEIAIYIKELQRKSRKNKEVRIQFNKKSKKLPRRELEHARIKLKDWLERKKEK